jgi:RNA polymerase sigma factor (sigma-70 family)
VEASALRHTARLPALAGRSPLLRLQTDEKLIALVRRGHHGAFEALVQRYQPRLLAFCRHMLSSQEDAEDVLQEVFAASFNAICADQRPINARPWLYRIARNRCLNHLRRPQPSGQDTMDVFERDGGASTADTVHRREEFLHLVADVRELPETQRTALLLREIDALSYEQIAETMDTTVPSVKSLLVRARVSLAEAAEARLLTCDEVRLELGQVAEGLAKTSAPARRHLRSCERCRVFKGELRRTTRALAAVYPIGPFVFLKKMSLAKLGIGGAASSAAASGSATTGGAGVAGVAGVAGGAAGAAGAGGGITAGGAVSAGVGTIATKAAAGVAAAAIVTAGAVEVRHATVAHRPVQSGQTTVAVPRVAQKPAPAPAKPAKVTSTRQVPAEPAPAPKPAVVARAQPVREAQAVPPQPPVAVPTQTAPAPPPPAPKPPAVEEEHSTVTLPTDSAPQDQSQSPPPPPAEGPMPGAPPPAAVPPAGEPDSGSSTPNPPPSN